MWNCRHCLIPGTNAQTETKTQSLGQNEHTKSHIADYIMVVYSPNMEDEADYIYSNRLALRIFINFFSNRSISYMIFLGENNILSAYPQTMHIEYKPCKDVLS